MRRGLADKYAKEDHRWDPGVLFICVDESETKDRDHVGDDGDNDAANGDCHAVVGDGAKDLAADDDIDDCEATANEDVENGAELGAPETE